MSDEVWKKFQKWKQEQAQFGKQAFSRYMMMSFLDGLERVSEEFVFKGGNLLWHYIKTPRETTDLDLSTLTLRSHKEVREQIEKSLEGHADVEFNIKEFQKVEREEDGLGVRVILGYKTLGGQKNQFQIDIVYALPTDLSKVKSTTSNIEYKAASIENIIADKVDASHRFGSGNTRLKDFDDLWRISKSEIKVDKEKLFKIINSRDLKLNLELSWAESMSDGWKAHTKKYKDVPKDLQDVFKAINIWLDGLSF